VGFSISAARRWWPLAVGVGVGVAAGAALFATTPVSYTAQTTLFLGSPVSIDSAGAYAGDLFSQQRAATYAQMFSSDDLAVKVIDDLSLPIAPADLAAEVSAKQVPKTVLLQVGVTDRSARRAADIANDYATNFAGYVARLETPATSTQSDAAITVVQKATAPTAPAAPSAALDLGGGAVAGLVLGVAGIWARRRLDRSIRHAAEAERATGVDVLGELPARHRGRLVSSAETEASGYAEALRKLRTNLIYLDVDHPAAVILLAGPTGSEPATATAADLGVLFGELDRRVVVVDADLRTPGLARYAGLDHPRGGRPETGTDAGGGLTQVLEQRTSIEAAAAEIKRDGRPGIVRAVPAGPVPPDPSELLASRTMTEVIDALRNAYDLVLIDAPAVLRYADAAVLAARVDGVVLVARAGRSTATQLSESATALRRVGARLLGTVLVHER
jgi:polysaccharide biosynthesis transport protein